MTCDRCHRIFKLPSVEYAKNEAYLVAHGVRALSCVHMYCKHSGQSDESFALLCDAGNDWPTAKPYRIEFEHEACIMIASGYAVDQWAINLYEWTKKNIKGELNASIQGLLFGYSSDNISAHHLKKRDQVLEVLR